MSWGTLGFRTGIGCHELALGRGAAKRLWDREVGVQTRLEPLDAFAAEHQQASKCRGQPYSGTLGSTQGQSRRPIGQYAVPGVA